MGVPQEGFALREYVPELVVVEPSLHVPVKLRVTVPEVDGGSFWSMVVDEGACPGGVAARVNVVVPSVDSPPVTAVTVPVSERFSGFWIVQPIVQPEPGPLWHVELAETGLLLPP